MKPDRRSMKIEGFSRLRALARVSFPAWSRGARARWILAKMSVREPKVPISSACYDVRVYRFPRVFRG